MLQQNDSNWKQLLNHWFSRNKKTNAWYRTMRNIDCVLKCYKIKVSYKEFIFISFHSKGSWKDFYANKVYKEEVDV